MTLLNALHQLSGSELIELYGNPEAKMNLDLFVDSAVAAVQTVKKKIHHLAVVVYPSLLRHCEILVIFEQSLGGDTKPETFLA